MSYSPQDTRVIEIKPLDKNKWHGKKGSEAFFRPHSLEALVDASTMQYATGLTKEDIESLSKYVSYDLSSFYNPEKEHPFWSTKIATLKMPNHTLLLHLNQPLHFIYWKMATASRFVANSLPEADSWPDATHYIADEKEVIEIEAKKAELETTAIIKASKINIDKKVQLVLVLGGKNVKGQSDQFINLEINKIIKHDPQAFLDLLQVDPVDVASRAIVKEALDKGVLTKSGGHITWFNEPLGMTEEDAAKFLSQDKNQDLKMAIQAKLA